MPKDSGRVSLACEQCRKRKTRCNGQKPCSACQYSMLTCRFPRTKTSRPVAEQVDHIESLVERIFQENDLIPSSDEDSDGAANDTDPEFGSRRIKVSPVDDPLYTSTLASEMLSPGYKKILQQSVTPEIYQRYRDISTKLDVLLIDTAGCVVGDLWQMDPAPPVDPAKYIIRAGELCSFEHYDELDESVKFLIPVGEFLQLNPKGSTADLFYGTLVCVLANDTKYAGGEPEFGEKLQFMQWALLCGIRNVMRQLLHPASEERLRAIIGLFLSTHVCWMEINCQVALSRYLIDICRDLGLHRRSIYLTCSGEKQSFLASLFWISYNINRTISMRYGCVTTMGKDEISQHIPTSIQNRLVNSCQHYTELFGVYDKLYDATCSSTAEGMPARQLVRHSLIALKDLASWWKRVHPKWSPDANPILIVDEFREMYQNDEAVNAIIFFTLSAYFYIKLYIFRMCALTPASVQDHLAAMFPVQVEALKKSSGTASNEFQSRIASLMAPSYSLRRSGIQFLKLCEAYLNIYTQSTTAYIDIMTVSAALTVNVVLCKLKETHVKQDSALFRRMAKTIRELKLVFNRELNILMAQKIETYADIMDACSTKEDDSEPISQTPREPSIKESPTSENRLSFELMNYDLARSIETELDGI